MTSMIRNMGMAIEAVDISVPSTTASGNTPLLTADLTKEGYVPIGVMGYQWLDGTRQNYANIWMMVINGNSLEIRLANLNTSSVMSGTLRFYIAYFPTK